MNKQNKKRMMAILLCFILCVSGISYPNISADATPQNAFEPTLICKKDNAVYFSDDSWFGRIFKPVLFTE